MASIHTRKNRDGSTTWRLFYTDASKKQRSVGFDSQEAAESWAGIFDTLGPVAALRSLKEAQGLIEPTGPDPTVEEMILAHIKELTGIQSGTRADYLTHARRDIFPHVGHYRRSEWTTKDLAADWVNTLDEQGLSGKTIKNRHALFSAAIQSQAVDPGHIQKNWLKGLRLPDPSRRREDMQALTTEEFALFLPCVRAFYRDLVVVLVGTGIRIGEAAALRVAHLRLDGPRPQLLVRDAVKHRRDAVREVGAPKTKRGTRDIPLAPKVVAALLRSVEGKRSTDHVFTSVTGLPLRYSTFHEDTWNPAQEKALAVGLRSKPAIHDMRHTCASWWLSNNVPLLTVSKLLGHERPSITLDLYGHFMPNDDQRAAEVTATLLSDIPEPAGLVTSA